LKVVVEVGRKWEVEDPLHVTGKNPAKISPELELFLSNLNF
jgi:hypothetical protein